MRSWRLYDRPQFMEKGLGPSTPLSENAQVLTLMHEVDNVKNYNGVKTTHTNSEKDLLCGSHTTLWKNHRSFNIQRCNAYRPIGGEHE